MLPVLTLHEPLLPVVQLTDDPPAVKLPATVAPPTSAPAASATVTVIVARQPLRTAEALPVRLATDTAVNTGSGGGVDEEDPSV